MPEQVDRDVDMEPPTTSGDVAPAQLAAEAASPSGNITGAAAAAVPTTIGADPPDSEDEVVQELDVYLNRMYDPPDFVGDLYVIQAPLRPKYRPYGDQGELDKVLLKPRSRRLKFEYKLKQGDNYESGSVNRDKGQKHVLTSTAVSNPNCSYAIGVIHQGRMTLTPVRAINQLRPDFTDYEEQNKKMEGPPDPGVPMDEEGGGAASSDSGREDTNAMGSMVNQDNITAAAARVEFVPAPRGGRGRAADEAKPPEEEEKWIRLDYFAENTEERSDIFHKHLVKPAVLAAEAEAQGTTSDDPNLMKLELDGDRESFLGVMCGHQPRRKPTKVEDGADSLSTHVLSRMPPERQIEAVVRHFGVVSYSRQLQVKLPPSTLRNHNVEAIVVMLQRCALLVAGNWVLKSEFACFEGAEAAARDILLYLFDKKNGRISAAEIEKWADTMKVGPARDEVLRSCSNPEAAGAWWALKNKPDKEFEARFPKLAQEQRAWFMTRKAQIGQERQGAKSSNVNRKDQAQVSVRARQRKQILVEVREILTEGAKTVDELRRAVQKKHANQKIQEDEIKTALQDPDLEAVQVRDLWVLSKTGNAGHDQFREMLFALFRKRDSVTKIEILEEYEQRNGTACKLSSYQIRSLLRDIADKADGGDTWVIKRALLRQGN